MKPAEAGPAEQAPAARPQPTEDPAHGTPAFHDDAREQATEDTKAEIAKLPKPTMGTFDPIVRTVFSLGDPGPIFTRLREELGLGMKASRADYGTQVDALDLAERNAQEAVELLVNAQVKLELYEIDAGVIVAALRQRAIDDLEATKTKGGKSITEGDVKARMATMFPDEWREVEGGTARAKGGVEVVRSLSERWKERARDLRTMVQTARGA